MILDLLAAPITVPIAGFNFILEQLLTMAEQELYDEDRIKEELLLLQVRLEEGEIDEDEYVAAEKETLERLRAARAYWREKSRASELDDDSPASVSIELPQTDDWIGRG